MYFYGLLSDPRIPACDYNDFAAEVRDVLHRVQGLGNKERLFPELTDFPRNRLRHVE